ncbi:hypothetical protein HDV06_000187 [Boothiomyces sp. JEL0866]|nr:hypothetical protein HDV06_000187 [Boothiomyces sp. JEL0866]
MSYENNTRLLNERNYKVVYRDFEQRLIEKISNYDISNSRELYPRLKTKHYLAHGSYGLVPEVLLECYREWSAEIESDPAVFYYRVLYPFLIRSVRVLADFINAKPTNVFLVPNVEIGIASVLQTYHGKTVCCFDLSYQAVVNQLEKFNLIKIPLPVLEKQAVLDTLRSFLESNQVDLGIFEHTTSPTGIVMPIKEIIEICKSFGVETLIDGAHGIGLIDLDFQKIQPDYYTSNFHKWMSSPRGCAFLYADPKHTVHPLITSWGYKLGSWNEFIWQGTNDYSAYLTIPLCIKLFKQLNYIERNNNLAKWTGEILSKAWDTRTLVEDYASMVTVILPPNLNNGFDLHDALYDRGIQVPVFVFRNEKMVRVSIHVYNNKADVIALGKTVLELYGYPHDYSGYSVLLQSKL